MCRSIPSGDLTTTLFAPSAIRYDSTATVTFMHDCYFNQTFALQKTCALRAGQDH
jgi:hypothetical protein